jgi:carbonic anhydrase
MPLRGLLASNRQWAARTAGDDPDFFNRLANQQAPQYLWIGCSDSRVPSTQLVDLAPGEMFVHRNVANQVIHTDFNCLSVLQFAVEVLQVRHIIVTGHYQCGGVKAAYADTRLGLIDNWLRPIQAIAALHEAELDALPPERRFDRLCELNVMEQVRHVAQTTIVQDAWARGQPLQVHGWIYNVADGLLHDLRVSLSAAADVAPRLP